MKKATELISQQYPIALNFKFSMRDKDTKNERLCQIYKRNENYY